MSETVIPERWKPQVCPRCKGTGRLNRVGYSSPMHMDSGAPPAEITESCYLCKGTGRQAPLVEDLMDRAEVAEHERDQLRAMLKRLYRCYSLCLECRQYKGHAPDCELARLLGRVSNV